MEARALRSPEDKREHTGNDECGSEVEHHVDDEYAVYCQICEPHHSLLVSVRLKSRVSRFQVARAEETEPVPGCCGCSLSAERRHRRPAAKAR